MQSGNPNPAASSVTQLLSAWRAGDKSALDQIVSAVHDELRIIASRMLRDERHAATLQATALVNEAYLRLADYERVDWQSRAQFFAIAASIIRHILIDHARTRLAQKRGGEAIRIALDQAIDLPAAERDLDLIALDDALLSLQSVDPRQSRIVELRFFGGLSVEETAEVMQISTATVKRDWTIARAFLFQQLSQRGGGS
jgi:RNA polymerase sigma factor (TIGR02999 family)